jgi:hypothetical protein
MSRIFLSHSMLRGDIGSGIDDILVMKAEKHTLCHGTPITWVHATVCRAIRLNGMLCGICLHEPLIFRIRLKNQVDARP